MKIINFPGASDKSGKDPSTKEFLRCELKENKFISNEIFRLSFSWQGPEPKAGQFFMIKPERTGVFLGRPISTAAWNPTKKIVEFMIAIRGVGTLDLSDMAPGEYAQLTGPLGNTWINYLSILYDNREFALVGGGIGVAPLLALAAELPEKSFDFYAGFKTKFRTNDERYGILGPVSSMDTKSEKPGGRLVIATEDGSEGFNGLITDFLEPGKYAAVCACGPAPMLKKIAAICKKADVYCFVSMEQRMACGVGACLGCTIKTKQGHLHCCTDGPIFPAQELRFDK